MDQVFEFESVVWNDMSVKAMDDHIQKLPFVIDTDTDLYSSGSPLWTYYVTIDSHEMEDEAAAKRIIEIIEYHARKEKGSY